METDRETGWAENTRKSRRTQAQRSRIRKRAHHAGTGDGKSGADKLFFFRSALRVHTDRRGQTCMHTGYKKIKKSYQNIWSVRKKSVPLHPQMRGIPFRSCKNEFFERFT